MVGSPDGPRRQGAATLGGRDQEHVAAVRRRQAIAQAHAHRDARVVVAEVVTTTVGVHAHRVQLEGAIVERLVRRLPDVIVAQHPDAVAGGDEVHGGGGGEVDALRVALAGDEDGERRHVARRERLRLDLAHLGPGDQRVGTRQGRVDPEGRQTEHVDPLVRPGLDQPQRFGARHVPRERSRQARVDRSAISVEALDHGHVADRDRHGSIDDALIVRGLERVRGGRRGRHHERVDPGDVAEPWLELQRARSVDRPRERDRRPGRGQRGVGGEGGDRGRPRRRRGHQLRAGREGERHKRQQRDDPPRAVGSADTCFVHVVRRPGTASRSVDAVAEALLTHQNVNVTRVLRPACAMLDVRSRSAYRRSVRRATEVCKHHRWAEPYAVHSGCTRRASRSIRQGCREPSANESS